jgi:hypothetical protein
MSVVYFLRRPSNLLIKIGRSSHFVSRYRQLCREYGEPLEILGIVDEDRFAEADLHRLFKDFRAVNEFFVETKGIRDFIAMYAEPYDPIKHGGRANECFVKVDRNLAHLIKRRAEKEGVKVQELLDRLLSSSL